MFIDRFDTENGRVQRVPADIIAANERPDANFPFVLITGRQLEHWHTGSMTRRASVLDAIKPMATASLCGADLLRLGVQPGEVITVQSRRRHAARRRGCLPTFSEPAATGCCAVEADLSVVSMNYCTRPSAVSRSCKLHDRIWQKAVSQLCTAYTGKGPTVACGLLRVGCSSLSHSHARGMALPLWDF